MRAVVCIVAVVLACSSARAAGYELDASTLRDVALASPPPVTQAQADAVVTAIDAEPAAAEYTQARRTYVVPQRYSFAYDDTRAFWFAAGSSAAVSLGTHVLIGLPTSLIAVVSVLAITAATPAVTVPLLCGIGGMYLLLHAGAAGLVSGLVFNGVSTIYDGSLLASIAGHVLGDLLAAGVVGLIFGSGLVLIGGLSGLAVFTGSAGLQTVIILSFLGALPAVVIAGVAVIAVPAVIGAWATAVSAVPRDGYAPAPDWKRPVSEGADVGEPTARRSDAPASPLVRLTVF